MEDIQALAEDWRKQQEKAELARKFLISEVWKAAQRGESEYWLAGQCEVSRQTIRAWLGKD
jgi:hypothetical protein